MTTTPKTTAVACPECGLPFAPDVHMGGLCPRCLMAAAVANLSTVDHPALGRFGDVGAAPDIEQLNQQLPQYEFFELLGRGGAGWVFRARQKSLDRPVAIKLLHGKSGGIVDAAQRFEREAQLLARLKHPRIVTVYDYGAISTGPYLVMDFVPGPTLRDVLRGPRLSAAAAVRIADQICEAVEYAHSMGVLHRDLKPENVLFESHGYADDLRVVDFGISRLIGDTEPGFHLTKTGFVVGTPFYAAPEQMTPTKAIDARADIFSIGVMLYEMLTGQLPRGRFARPSQLAKVPAALDTVTLRCLESDPERRFRDVKSLRQALEAAITGSANWHRAAWLSAASAALGALIVWAALAWSGGEPGEMAKTGPPSRQKLPATTTTPDRTVATLPNVPAPDEQNLPKSNQQQPASPPREEAYFELSDVRVYGFSPFTMEVRIDGRQAYEAFELKQGATLVWVVQTDGPHRIDTPFTLPTGKREFTIADRLTLDFRDRWPIEVYLAERWYAPEAGSLRLSNIVRLERGDVRSGVAPPAAPTGNRVLIPAPANPR